MQDLLHAVAQYASVAGISWKSCHDQPNNLFEQV
jgi:hypothetical protein